MRVGATTHVIDEAKSPDDAQIWVMWCGASCFVLDDTAGNQAGTLIPFMDFYVEIGADGATCPACRERLGLLALTRRMLVGA